MQLHVLCNLSYATTQICSYMCRMQLNFSCMQQLQNPKFLVVHPIKASWVNELDMEHAQEAIKEFHNRLAKK